MANKKTMEERFKDFTFCSVFENDDFEVIKLDTLNFIKKEIKLAIQSRDEEIEGILSKHQAFMPMNTYHDILSAIKQSRV